VVWHDCMLRGVTSRPLTGLTGGSLVGTSASYWMICDGETGVVNYVGAGNYCPSVSSGAGICRNHCRSVESMAKRTG